MRSVRGARAGMFRRIGIGGGMGVAVVLGVGVVVVGVDRITGGGIAIVDGREVV